MITKEKILEKVGGEEYLIRYLVPTFRSNLRKKNYKSIFSEKDDRPSMSIYQEKGTWKFKSFNTGHQGDAFKMWADYYGLDCRTQFKELLELIDQEMCLGLCDNKGQNVIHKPIYSNTSIVKKPESSLPSQTLSIEYIPYSESFISKLYLEYWSQYGIDQSVLERFDVKQVAFLSYTSNSGRSLSFKYAEKHQIVAAYHISGRVKVYIPSIECSFSSDPYFKGQKKSFSYKNQTKDDVFGLVQLPEGNLDYVLFTAGEKDCMSAYAHGFVNVISLQSEHQMPSDDLLRVLCSKTFVLLCCYDNDEAGKNASKKLRDSFGIVSVQLPGDVKDIAEYFQRYTTNDFQILIDSSVQQVQSITVNSINNHNVRKSCSTKRSKVKAYLSNKFNFRLNVVTQEREMSIKRNPDLWKKINVNELRDNLDRHNFECSLDLINCILKSFFVERFNPIESYFLSFEGNEFDGSKDYIRQLANYVHLKDPTSESNQYWYTHLRKWMIRSIRTVFEPEGINKHALILCSVKENIGKSYFCRFLCPRSLIKYYNGNPVISNEKDAQKSLIRNFIINLDELHQLRSNSEVIKAWISQPYVNVRLPYQEDEITAPRIASFLGSTNNVEFLRSDLGNSRWISFEVDSIDYLDDEAIYILEKAWEEAYHLYKFDNCSGELSEKEFLELKIRSDQFKTKSTEVELIVQYLSPSTKSEGEFMTATDILRYLQGIVGTTIRLNTKLVGSALREAGFDRVAITNKYGYWVLRHMSYR
ncbi:VapE domain-containing protein [Cardinium endosymbiont of Dermatophagoides farinae]|uniref:VapE domain-containing protein n=1 Tax=Cardinium endosymbiont of Dermatophagoides farinae TaxID=2597823 RepID=UPI00118371CD|nr:VapE domain-containing protein [Cardinium endosymbiont of Dermatophagoides farinae]TSJ80187.1 virulence protein [Cardinium endosymbiont of Dermatophagoides farinae]